MPADTRNPAASRRTFRKLSTEEEIEIRRARGEISCAECRRLKLKCDKKLPCGSCVRRGCPSVCPNGSLTTGQGTRFVLADTEQLHRKISEMGQRIRQLEDALTIFQSGVSTEIHPLLRDELLPIKFGPEVQQTDEPESGMKDTLTESMDALGTLTIGDNGESKYYGRSAGSETLLLAGAELEMEYLEKETRTITTPSLLNKLARMFPVGSGCAPESEIAESAMDMLFESLPPRPRAWSLCETYMEQASWLFRPLRREEIIDDLLTPIYNAKEEREDPNCSIRALTSPHKFAVLYLVFAQGALVDLTLPIYNEEAENYHHYARAALTLRSIFDSPMIETVQAIVLLAYYHSNAGKRYTQDSVWTLLSLGAKLAQSLGLHRDPARWNMNAKTVERRRSLFWEICSSDLFHSMALGRPPAIRLSYIDCVIPQDSTDPEVQFLSWKHQFSRDILASVIELTLAATPPSYETILDLDRKVREKTLPPSLNIFVTRDDEYISPSVYMRGCLLSQFRSITMLYIHRSFFAQALLDYPANPLRSPYAPSFLAAYRCASVIIKSSINHFERFPELCTRWWQLWTHLFSAAIIVGSIVTRAPSSNMASTAFIELGLAFNLFQKGAKNSRRARSGMTILTKLKEKAFLVFAQFRSGTVSTTRIPQIFTSQEDGTDELAIFGGQTRVLVSKLLSQKPPNWDMKAAGVSPAVTSPSSDSTPLSPASTFSSPILSPSGAARAFSNAPEQQDVGMQEVHPRLMQYMSMFPAPDLSSEFNVYPDLNMPPQSLDQSILNGVSAFPQFNSSAQIPNFPEYQVPMGTSMQQNQPQAGSSGFSYETQSFDAYQQPYAGAATSPSASTPETTGSNDLMELGMMMNGDSGIDEQWMAFMRESGIINSSVDT